MARPSAHWSSGRPAWSSARMTGTDARSAREGFTKTLRHLPALLRKTLTDDRGKEMAEHERLAERLAIGESESYLAGGIPRSLQIFFARMSTISVWRGIADRVFRAGLCHQECRAPSRSCTHP